MQRRKPRDSGRAGAHPRLGRPNGDALADARLAVAGPERHPEADRVADADSETDRHADAQADRQADRHAGR